MRQTLFHIPSEVFGWPMLGITGWALLFWCLMSFAFAWPTIRQHGWVEALPGLVIYLLMGFVVLGFALPRLEDKVGTINLGLPVRGYGVSMFFAVSAGVALAIYRGMRMGIDSERVIALAIWLFVPGILGARLFYLIQNFEEIPRDSVRGFLGHCLNVAGGGLVVYGSLIGALLAYTVFVWRHKLPPLVIADLLAPSMLIGLAIGRIGCLMNGCCYGSPCEYAWAIQFPQESLPYEIQLQRGLQHGLYWSKPVSEATEEPGIAASDFKIRYVQPDGPAAKAGVEKDRWLTNQSAAALARAKPYAEVSTSVEERKDEGDPVRGDFRWTAGLMPPRSLPTNPTQLYSSLNAFLLCGLVLAIGPFAKRDGILLAVTLTVYPVTRFLLEIVRVDELSVNGLGWTISQTVSVGILFVAALLWFLILRDSSGRTTARQVVRGEPVGPR